MPERTEFLLELLPDHDDEEHSRLCEALARLLLKFADDIKRELGGATSTP